MNPEIAQTISHYRLLEKLGKGGMGIVFKAHDLKLDRYVALKFLPMQVELHPDVKDRFTQEAKTASALDHPNICTIYEINDTESGQVFISMALYEGETLKSNIEKGPLSVGQTIDITRQICEGLSKAHSKGIVHRDIKPANVIITNDNIVKILDFGVAKFQHSTSTTLPGSIIGTPGYMAPEQAKGKEVDHRADIWATGVLLFEMLTSQLPFEGNSDLSLMYAIVNEQPLPLADFRPNVPEILNIILDKTLAKDPDQRYLSMEEFIQDLKSVNHTQADSEKTVALKPQIQITPSLAVLPFNDLSPDKDQEYFCDGLAEEIINTLSRVEGLRVVSRNSSFQFKGTDTDLLEIGKKLKVQSVLEGSIRKAKNKVRIAIRLSQISDGFLVWAEEFDRTIDDIFEVQDEISQTVTENLAGRLLKEEEQPGTKLRTDLVEAYNLYLKGRFHWNQRTADALEKSIHFFEEAIQLDSEYALAYAGLADVYTVLGFYSKYPPHEVFPRAMQAAEQALEMDETLAEAYVSLGCAKAVYEWNWKDAEKLFKKGIELKPDYALAHHWYAINFLAPLARFDEAKEQTKKALDLDPISLVIGTTMGLIYYFARDYESAIKYFQKILEMNPDYPVTNFFLARTLTLMSRYEEAAPYFQKALKFFGDSTNMLATFGCASAQQGLKDVAEKILSQLLELSDQIYVSAYDLASIYCGLDDKQKAMDYLEKAFDERSYLLCYIHVDPFMDPLRNEKKFQEIVRQIFMRT